MPQKRNRRRAKLQLPVLCRIRNRRDEIIISTTGKTNNVSLGGMNISLPVHLVMIHSRLIEHTLELPDPYESLEGNGVLRWGFWDQENWQTTFGLEMNELPGEQWLALENLMSEIAEDDTAPFFQSLNN